MVMAGLPLPNELFWASSKVRPNARCRIAGWSMLTVDSLSPPNFGKK